MSHINKKVPKRRFQEFNNAVAWEQRKLLEHIEKVLDFRGKSPTKFGMEWLDKGYLVLSALNVKAGYIDKSVEAKFGSQELFDKWMGEQRLRKGDVVFTTEAPLGNVAQIPDNNGYILNQRAVAFKTFPDIMDNDFLAQFLRSPFFQHKLNMNASGGTAKGIGMKEFAKLSSYLPKDVKEQKKIGALLKTIDNIIALHQRKLEKIKALKTAYLSEMFPAEGETKPKRRFGGFTDDWEQRKFIEIINRLSKTSNSSILPKVEYEDIIAEEGRLNKDISNKFDSRKGILFQPKNILYGKLRPYLKNWLYPDFKGVAVGDFWVFEAIEATPRFIYNLIQSDSYQKVANDTAETKMPRSDWTKVSNSSFFIPKESSEQKRIGTFFKQLDDTIALHQRKLQKLQNIKKAYLNEMFI
ncbi:restriction endonuclease subunit S [Listeria monocytogenes]|nr:restriction endonuclease subunit S [Listeria monocytogenes]EMC9549864.1 restriction endonuclease subunit S [Listeria monocytogenes]